jgi:acyl dehydratase
VIDSQAIFAYDFGAPEQSYAARDAILYALGVGLGQDPLDRADIAFLDERELSLLPSFAVTLCSPGMWIREPRLGADFGKLVHSAQLAEFFTPLPPAARVRGSAKVLSLTDRGEGKGAVLVLERHIADAESGSLYCRLEQTLLLRGDGGFGGEPTPRNTTPFPDRPADATCRFATSPRAALIYRLSGDWNPLHLDPGAAALAGFSRPILHGLASYGIAGVAASRALCRSPVHVRSLACSFAGIVMPGDELQFNLWAEGANRALFTAHVGERKVLDGGNIEWIDQ